MNSVIMSSSITIQDYTERSIVVFGTDTKKWIGKQLVLETYKTKTSDGR